MSMKEEDGGKIKPANYRQSYTPEQMLELYRCQSDPIYFIEKYVMIQHPKWGAIKFRLYEYQKKLIRVYHSERLVIALLSRQVGKTQTAAAYLLWWAMFKDNQTILIASKDQDGANEIMERLWYAYEECPWFLKPGVKKNDVKSKYFSNGSKIRSTATTKSSGRGKSNSLIYLDEFAFVRPSVAGEFWTSIYPTLSTGGNCIITSTPNTDEDKFATIWFNAEPHPLSDKWVDKMAEQFKARQKIEEGRDKYEPIFETDKVKDEYDIRSTVLKRMDAEEEDEVRFKSFHTHWTSVPTEIVDGVPVKFRDARFKRETISAGLTESEWMREYECAFVSGDSTLISGQKLAALRFFVRPPRYICADGVRWYEEIEPNMPYAISLDPSEGVGLDDACIQVWEIPTLRQVAEWNSNTATQGDQVRILKKILTTLYVAQQDMPEHDGRCDLYYSLERNGQGVGIIRAIEYEGEHTFPGWLVDASETSINVKAEGRGQYKLNRWRGLITNTVNKRRYCLEFKSLVERNLFIPRSEFLASQMKSFIKDGNSYGAKEGSKDDIMMSCVIMCMLIDEIRVHEPDLDDYIRPSTVEEPYDEDDLRHPDNIPMIPMV